MEAEGFCGGFGSNARSGLGLVDEHDGYALVCGIFPSESASVSGLLRDGADFDGPNIVGSKEMGLLGGLAVCEHCKLDFISEGRVGVHADCQHSLFD